MDREIAIKLAEKKSDEKHQLSGETSTNDKDICEQIKKHAERIKEETDKNPNSLWSQGMRSFDGWGQVTGKLKNPDDSLVTEDSEVCKEQKSKLDCISRQQAIEALTGWQTEPLDEDIVRTLNNLPPVTPTDSEDCVSREDLLKHAYLRDGVMSVSVDSIKLAPSVIPIWRATETMIVDGVEMEIDPVSYEVGYSHGQTAPIERTGEWVRHELWDMPWFTCSECNFHGRSDYKFCPNCGAKMGGDE